MEPTESRLYATKGEQRQPARETPGRETSRVRPEREILADFTPEQRVEIEQKKQVLSALAHFIGKDFKLPVELNEPGQGWHWDFDANKVRIDPKDLLEKPMEYLRFVIAHEGGHRRVSRVDTIPKEQWQQPGFPFLMNAIEDPRTNNFVAESYPRFRQHMELAYEHDLDIENHAKAKAEKKLGYQPRFMQAGFEYIKQWFAKERDKSTDISKELPPEVQEVVRNTLTSAEDAWLRYPSRQEADSGEEIIKKYANVSYEIIRDEVWPDFRTLIEQDQKDQQTQEMLKDMEGQAGDGQGLPGELSEKLTDAQEQELKEALKKALEAAAGEADAETPAGAHPITQPISLGELSEELRAKLKEFIDGLAEDKKGELAERAAAALKEFEHDLDEALAGKLSDNPERVHPEEAESVPTEPVKLESTESRAERLSQDEKAEVERYRKFVTEELYKDETTYEQYRKEVLPVIDQLENDLRQIFSARRESKWLSGYRTGKRLDMKRRIQEKAKAVPVVQTRSFERRELPREKDYAVTLLVDLSGSMQVGGKITETFKGTVVLAEVLNRLSINTEIIGFNDRIHDFQTFGQKMSPEIRNSMSEMLQEVSTAHAEWNDDGWALEQASARLSKQRAKEKFLIVLSDGLPWPSPEHVGSQFELSTVVNDVAKRTGQKLIGLGIGPGTQHVETYYPNSIANVGVQEMASKLADVIREAIVNYDQF